FPITKSSVLGIDPSNPK
ncbi:hypothetical protein JCM6882_003209, partial [Rhodosporidiobolus microsporus]